MITFVFTVVGTPPIKTTGSLGTWFGLVLVFTGPLRIVEGAVVIVRVGVGVGVGVADGVTEGEEFPPPEFPDPEPVGVTANEASEFLVVEWNILLLFLL